MRILQWVLIFFLWPASCVLSQQQWLDIPLDLTPLSDGGKTSYPVYGINRPRIALALSGGGSRGLAQIGVLKVFQRYGLPIDYIAGTSIGAVIGGLTAVGYSAPELEDISKSIQWNEIMSDSPSRQTLFLSQKAQESRALFQIRFKSWQPVLGSAFTSGHKLNVLLSKLIYEAPNPPTTNFDNLSIRFRSVATDLLSGEKIIFRSGSLSDAMHASMAIPLLFEPVQLNRFWLVDGGLVQNMPVKEARDFDADLVIAVDTSSKLRSQSDLKRPWQVADQVTTILHKAALEKELNNADFVIQPVLENISNSDFSNIPHLIQSGETAAEALIPQIEERLVSLGTPAQSDSFFVARISMMIDSISALDSLLTLQPNSRITRTDIVWQGQTLYQSGKFKFVSAQIDTANHHLRFSACSNPVIQTVQITGHSLFSDETLLAELLNRPGRRYNFNHNRVDKRRIKNSYNDAGYSLASVVQYDLDQHGTLSIHIGEGRIANINLVGNQRTRASTIQRDVSLMPGQVFNSRELAGCIENLYATGLFEGVRFSLQPNGGDNDLQIILHEKPYTRLDFGLRYDLERQTKTFLEITEENLTGLDIQGSLNATIGAWDKSLTAGIRTDRLFNSLWTVHSLFKLYNNRNKYYQQFENSGIFTENGWQTQVSFGRQMEKLGTVWARLGFQKSRTRLKTGSFVPEEDVYLSHIAIRSEVDTRDRFPFPIRGKYNVLECESGLTFLGTDHPYFRLYSSMRSYYPLNKHLVLSPHIEWGTVDLTAPFIKQFRFGGLDQFFGLPYLAEVGRRFFVVNMELNYKIPWFQTIRQFLSLRYDLGGIWGRYSKINTEDFRQSVGFSYSVKTPLGPFRFAWGRMNLGKSLIYLSLGHAF